MNTPFTSIKQRALWIHSVLDHYFPNTPIPLTHTSPYTLLIAVLLSAQCTDARVNLVTPSLFAKATSPEEMILLSVDQIKEIIKTCGLSNNKAKAISALSHILLEKYDGEVPSS